MFRLSALRRRGCSSQAPTMWSPSQAPKVKSRWSWRSRCALRAAAPSSQHRRVVAAASCFLGPSPPTAWSYRCVLGVTTTATTRTTRMRMIVRLRTRDLRRRRRPLGPASSSTAPQTQTSVWRARRTTFLGSSVIPSRRACQRRGRATPPSGPSARRRWRATLPGLSSQPTTSTGHGWRVRCSEPLRAVAPSYRLRCRGLASRTARPPWQTARRRR
mmetsp:Transcript_78991/g.228343  ORF Transcript_78991/g.228343 Transcript_78991/m.228343 type:complete len:216 (+) Transcript_78991:357-1004(+)